MKRLLLLASISLYASEKKNYHLKVPPKITTPYSSMPQPKTPNNSPILKRSKITIKLTDGTVITKEEIQKIKSKN